MKDELSPRQMIAALFGLLFIFGLGLWVTWRGPSTELTPAHLWYSDGFKWLITGILLVTVIYWEQNSLSSIGLRRPSWLDWALIPLVAILMLLAELFIGKPLLELFHTEMDTSAVSFFLELPVYHKIVIVVTAGITEEIMYRGYTIERLEALTSSTALAVILSTVAFIGVHLPVFGLGNVIQQTIVTLILALVYVWRRNLVAPIGAHMILDALGIIFA